MREEEHGDAVLAGVRQLDALFGHLGSEQAVRDLEEHSGAVAGERVGANGTAVGEVGECSETLVDDLSALAALDVGDEPDAAGVMIEPGVIEPLVTAVAVTRSTWFLAPGAASDDFR